ncbi:hypothetical protein ATANTOWER_013966 [Ataeniobius toweri]|uniref:Uncharacterized protein n=1 Tax=Ataeniobius toweri TaxID=208326 RepID=A0ABU7A6I4_9TELE|nr:hypothetical protein [Ataeniobius toweri]
MDYEPTFHLAIFSPAAELAQKDFFKNLLCLRWTPTSAVTTDFQLLEPERQNSFSAQTDRRRLSMLVGMII